MSDKSQICHVHLWKTSDKKDLGHIALEAKGVYISFWPKGEKDGLFDSITGRPGRCIDSFHREVKKKGYPTLTLHVQDMDVDKIIMWWKVFKMNDPKWSLLITSCSNIVYKALCEGNDLFNGRVSGFATTPKSLAKLIECHIKRRKGTIKFASICTTSSKKVDSDQTEEFTEK